MSKPRAIALLSRALLLAGLVALSGCPIVRRDSILTQHNDSYRTGLYATERSLTPAAVASRGMVLLYARSVDGRIAGQLLYVPSLRMQSGVVSDVVFVTTTKNVVYAYDANERGGSGTEQGLLWKTTLGPSHPTNPDWTGVLSTPVIDPDRNTMFVVYKTWDDGHPAHWLAALDIRNDIRDDGNVLNKTRISARTTRSDGSALVFDSEHQGQRPGLLLSGGAIHIGFGSCCGEGDGEFHGWVLSYDAQTLQQRSAFCTTPDFRWSADLPGTRKGSGAGVWQGGGGLVGDDTGNVYVLTGNGADVRRQASSHGDSVVKLAPRGTAWAIDGFWAPPPDRADLLEDKDLDLGAGGALVIPGGDRLVGGGKTGMLYVLPRSALSLSATPQAVQAGVNVYDPTRQDYFWEGGPHLHGAPAYWRASGQDHGYVYVWPEVDILKRYVYRPDAGSLDPVPLHGDIAGPPCFPDDVPDGLMCAMPGGMLSISSNDNAPGTGIVWATLPRSAHPHDLYPVGRPPPGQILAYHAETLARLWSAPLPRIGGDEPAFLGKWTPPTVADGKLFVATSSGQFLVYELGPRRLPDSVEAALFVDDDHRLEVTWFDERDGLGWHEPVAISGPIAPPGAPVAVARQSATVLSALFVGDDRRLHVAWLDVGTGAGWQGPVAISDPFARPGASVAAAKQTDRVLTALIAGEDDRIHVAWLNPDDNNGQWHKPQPISDPILPAQAAIALVRQSDRVLAGMFVDRDWRLEIVWLNLDDNRGQWHAPQAFTGPVAPPGSAIAMAKQTDKVVTAMFVDKDQQLAVAWLNPDDNDGHWHLPQAISGAVAPPGSTVALAKQTDSVLTAMLVGHDRKLQVAWLDLAGGSWHAPQPISGVLAPPGAAVALGKQSEQVFAALVVGDDRRLQVASLDLSEGQPWLWPQPISRAVAPAGVRVTMARQSP